MLCSLELNLPSLQRFVFTTAISLALAAPFVASWASSIPQVDLGYEIHQGWFNVNLLRSLFYKNFAKKKQETGQFYNFSNVRYAAPPIGNLRFQPPVAPPTPTTPVINNGSNFVICPQATPAWNTVGIEWLTQGLGSINVSAGYQAPNITTLPPVQPGTTEDCLFLDILVPKAIFDQRNSGRGAPVLVWVHGGGYTLGWKNLYGSGAGLLAASQTNNKEGIIYVAVNYRLGLFGFLSGPTFQENGTANNGLLDQRFALEWVQQYISRFGGDPSRVTLMGESAGGGSTIHQITAYGGLKGPVPFRQAISQSGAWLPTPYPIQQENIFNNFLNKANVSTLQEARALSTEDLQLVNWQLVGEATYGDYTFNPVVDGSFSPALPGLLLLHGKFDQSLKVLIGHNGDEGLFFTSPFVPDEETFKQNVVIVSFPDADTDNATGYIMNTLYPPIFDGSHGYTDMIARADYIVSEALFSCNANYLARAFNKNAFSYLFSVPPALHGADIYYTFYDGPDPNVLNDTLALIMQEYITNFVINGDPSGPGIPAFPNYSASGGQIQNLNTSLISLTPDDVANERCYWWQKALYY